MIEASLQARGRDPADKPENFDEWNVRNLGERLTEIFMRPYNFKVWAIPATKVPICTVFDTPLPYHTTGLTTRFPLILDERDVAWRASCCPQRQAAYVQRGSQQGRWTLGT